MFYIYDDYGWFLREDENSDHRATEIIPMSVVTDRVVGEPYPNWAGSEWRLMPYVAAEPIVIPEPEPVPEDPRMWWIDEGPYKDRFGMDGVLIYASDHRLCRAMVGLISGRKYINLKDPKIQMLMYMLVQAGLPTADPMVPGAGPLTPAKVAAVLNTPTTEYERHVKGLEQQTEEAQRAAAVEFKDM